MINTIRIILFLKCDMHCYYCCNEQQQFNSQFIKMSFDEIDFTKYQNVCLSGGEPFINKKLLYETIDKIPEGKNIFIYSNGVNINDDDIKKLKNINDLKSINVGLHYTKQLSKVNIKLEKELPVRFMCQDTKYERFLTLYPERLNNNNLKSWKLNDCNMPNEEWILLT